MNEAAGSGKSADAYRTIGEVAEELKLPQHVLRFWETRFPQVKPLKRAGGRRFYRPDDVALLRAIKAMLYGQGYTIKGVQRLLQDQGPRSLAAAATAPAAPIPVGAAQPPGGRSTSREREPEPTGESGRADRQMRPPAESAPDGRQRLSASLATLLERLDAVARDLAECSRMLDAARVMDDQP